MQAVPEGRLGLRHACSACGCTCAMHEALNVHVSSAIALDLESTSGYHCAWPTTLVDSITELDSRTEQSVQELWQLCWF